MYPTLTDMRGSTLAHGLDTYIDHISRSVRNPTELQGRDVNQSTPQANSLGLNAC